MNAARREVRDPMRPTSRRVRETTVSHSFGRGREHSPLYWPAVYGSLLIGLDASNRPRLPTEKHSQRLNATLIPALQMTGPHDKFVKQMFSNVKHAAVELRAVLPSALLTQLDLSTLQVCPGSFVDRRLRQVHSDLLYSVQLDTHQAYIYVLLEHQSTPDATMPFRLLEYLVKIWREHIERTDETPSARLAICALLSSVDQCSVRCASTKPQGLDPR